MLLHFIHALTHGLDRSGSRGLRVQHAADAHHATICAIEDVDEALDELGHAVADWSGGTRIGEAVRAFNYRWARRVLGRGAVVLLISDGWDRGRQPDCSRREMARLQRSAHRLIWLNPLAGGRRLRTCPAWHGCCAGLTWTTSCPVGNLASLEQLAEILSAIPAIRPERKQHPYQPPVAPPLLQSHEPRPGASRTGAGLRQHTSVRDPPGKAARSRALATPIEGFLSAGPPLPPLRTCWWRRARRQPGSRCSGTCG